MHTQTALLVAASALACLTGVNLLTSYFVVRTGTAHTPAEHHYSAFAPPHSITPAPPHTLPSSPWS